VLLALVVILMVTAPLAIKRLPLPLGSQPIDAPMPRTLGLSVLSTGELYLEGHAVSRAELASALRASAAAAAAAAQHEIQSARIARYARTVGASPA
jgi:biopolymer transport protein ExbD/biopolymer transport protein TolR